MDAALQQALLTMPLATLFANPPKPTTLKRIDFRDRLLSDAVDTGKYQIMLSHCIPSDRNAVVAALFLGNMSVPILWSTQFGGKTSAWHHAVNRAFEAGVSSQLAFAYGKHIYECVGISGTCYLAWATYVYRVRDGVSSVLGANMPVLINMDSDMTVKAVMVFRSRVDDASDLDRLPITVDSPKLLWNRKLCEGHPFVCESRPSPTTPDDVHPIETMLEREARQLLNAPGAVATKTAARPIPPVMLHNPFSNSLDQEDSAEGDDGSGISFDLDDVYPAPAQQEIPLRLIPRPVIGNGSIIIE